MFTKKMNYGNIVSKINVKELLIVEILCTDIEMTHHYKTNIFLTTLRI